MSLSETDISLKGWKLTRMQLMTGKLVSGGVLAHKHELQLNKDDWQRRRQKTSRPELSISIYILIIDCLKYCGRTAKEKKIEILSHGNNMDVSMHLKGCFVTAFIFIVRLYQREACKITTNQQQFGTKEIPTLQHSTVLCYTPLVNKDNHHFSQHD